MTTIPDTQQLTVSSNQVCACETATVTRQRTQVKTNSFQFGGRIDVAESAQESSSNQFSQQSTGSASRQATKILNNQAGSGAAAPNGTCISMCQQ
jgi:hypothetical protein